MEVVTTVSIIGRENCSFFNSSELFVEDFPDTTISPGWIGSNFPGGKYHLEGGAGKEVYPLKSHSLRQLFHSSYPSDFLFSFERKDLQLF